MISTRLGRSGVGRALNPSDGEEAYEQPAFDGFESHELAWPRV